MARSLIAGPPQGSSPSIKGSQTKHEASHATAEATLAQVEQMRLLILGMQQRLQTREETLTKAIERAEGEGMKFEELRRSMLSAKS